MAVFKKHVKVNFSIISNEVINDNRLSWKARGILIYLLSKPEIWEASFKNLNSSSDKDGVDSIKSAFKELRELGYVKLYRGMREYRGKLKLGTYYDVFGEPQ